jgi:hypothetical protein
MSGLNDQPDLCIDKNGTLHCVFVHKLASNWRKIYYTKSTDDGENWITPEDISLNNDLTMYGPHIVSDTNNILYVSYDYNVGNPAMSLIYLKNFDGTQWSEPFVVSEGMYNSDYNLLYIDHNDRIYVFFSYLDHWTNYRLYENGQWSVVYTLYAEQGSLETMSVVIDGENNLHCIGWGTYNGGGPYAIYFSYICDDFWNDWTIISQETDLGAVGGGDIGIINYEYPAITYRQKTYGTGQDNDSTMYTYFDGNVWSVPELVVNDPYEQQIAIDPYQRVHIIDREKLETGTKLVHYQKINDLWQGYIIDDADNLTNFPDLSQINGKLYLVYNKSDVPANANVYITKYNIITGIDSEANKVVVFKLFPNPFKAETTVEFETSNQIQINISIYNLSGQKIITLMNEEIKPAKYRMIWNGKDLNGKEVEAGLYLVRLQSGPPEDGRAGRNIVTQPVEVIK